MKMRELFDRLQRDLPDCADSEVIIELSDPAGKLVRATFLAARVVVRRDSKDEYVLCMAWPTV